MRNMSDSSLDPTLLFDNPRSGISYSTMLLLFFFIQSLKSENIVKGGLKGERMV